MYKQKQWKAKVFAAVLAVAMLAMSACAVPENKTAPADRGQEAAVAISTPLLDAPAVSAAEPSVPEAAEDPLAGIVIGLDPGHQAMQNSEPEPVSPGSSESKPKVSSGTQGVRSGVEEHAVNLNVALALRDMLRDEGAAVVMTRTKADADISNKERAQLFNENKVDLALRIHCNGIDDESVRGAFMLIPKNNPFEADCKRAAQLVIDNYVKETGFKNCQLKFEATRPALTGVRGLL